MPPAVQKALFLTEKFGTISVQETQVYKPGPGEVLVKVHSTSLNPIDWKVQRMGLLVTEFPAVLGTDVAGEVVEVGEGVVGFEVGDRVFSHGVFENRHASFQQYTIAWAASTAKIPPNITYDEAAAIPLALTTSTVGIYNVSPYGMGLSVPSSDETTGIYAGKPFVVIGGSSSVGQMVIQLARISGFSPIITTASLKHTEHLKSLGATHILDRNLSNAELLSQFREISSEIQHIYDCVSYPETQQLAWDILSPGGQLAVVLPPIVESSPGKTVIHVWGNSRVPENRKLVAEFYHDTIYGLLERGLIKANNVEILPNGLAGIAEGFERMEKDQISALKLIAHPQE
ncbi:medium-chain dehydrogenase/reductase like protein [Agrocybe pediades]|nr:medium-chain dehydrogenase/reductase like protein [Agrocybe pediades]